MKTVLLITARFDPAADLVLAELRSRGARCVRWNTREFPIESRLSYWLSNSDFHGEIASDNHTLDLADIGSIWWQWDDPVGFPPELSGAERRFAESEARLAIAALMTVGDFFWVNHPARERVAGSKPAQLLVASQLGFDVPNTVVTNDPDKVRHFLASSRKQVVYKGFSQPDNMEPGKALFTGVLTEEAVANIDLIKLTPGIFQERVDKDYEVRSTVVGSKIFSARINSQAHADGALDWRRALHDVEYEPISIPEDIQQKILLFMKRFGLVYGAFDFIVTPDSRYVFLEVNPSGQYMWLECATGLGITSALAHLLIRGAVE